MNATFRYGLQPPAALVVAAALLAGCDAQPRVIGVSTSPTFLDAARMAVADATETGPVQGLDTVMIPSGSTVAEPAVRSATELVAVDGIVAVVGHSNSAASLAAAPIYGEHGVVQVSPTASAVVYSRAGPYSFRLVPPDDRQADFLAEKITERLPGGGRLAVFYVNDAYGRGLRNDLLARVEGGAFDIVVDAPHMEAGVDDDGPVRAEAVLNRTRPDAVVWLGRGRMLDAYLDAIRRALPEAPVFGSDALSDGSIPPSPGPRYAGVFGVSYVDLAAGDRGRRFSQRYRERFGLAASGPHALTYDAVSLLISGLRAGADSGPEMRRYLDSLGRERPVFQGVTGPIRFDADGDIDRSYHLVHLGPGSAR